MNAFLFGAGELRALPPTPHPQEDDLLIAADGGLAHLTALGMAPSLLIGDFDSGELPSSAPCEVLRFPIEKDETDMQLAIEQALARGAERIFLFGGVGGRMDHTLANLACLADLEARGHEAYLFGDGVVFRIIQNRTLALPHDLPFELAAGTASIFAWGGDAEGVSIHGMKYEAEGITLTPRMPLGVSNYLPLSGATVSVSEGMLLLVLPIPRITASELPKRR